MTSFYEFLKKMGGLHDSMLTSFAWYSNERKIKFCFEDIYSNFDGLPEYPNAKSGSIVLHDVSNVTIFLESNIPLRIFEFIIEEDKPNILLATFTPNGKISLQFGSVDYPLSELKSAISNHSKQIH